MRDQTPLPFDYEVDEEDDSVTALGGLPIVLDAMRALGVVDAIRSDVKVSARKREFDEVTCATSTILMMAAGGDCIDDIEQLRCDEALKRLLDIEIPSPETLRQFLYKFHSDELVNRAEEEVKARGKKAAIPEETDALKGLARVNTKLIAAMNKRAPKTEATLDIDATVQESHKREAKVHYLGGRGYQPITATWAEQDLVVFDQFRDGNVPAEMSMLEVVRGAFAGLPESVTTRRMRADTASYSSETLLWLAEQKIEFAIGARMKGGLTEACKAVPEDKWQQYEERGDTLIHVAEVEYVPSTLENLRGTLRYIGVRFTPRQESMVDDDDRKTFYLAVATNRMLAPLDLLKWHWAKAGTIEHVHDVLKNELGAGVLPCGRFGANAAWFRLAVLTYNVLRVVRMVGPEDLREARPKRLRFNLFTIVAAVTWHARRLVGRLKQKLDRAQSLIAGRTVLWTQQPA